MKNIQGSFIVGYVTVLVIGDKPELFFQACIDRGIPVWDVKKTDEQTCTGNVHLKHLTVIRTIKRETNYKLKFIDKKGYPFLIRRFIRRKEIVIASILSLMLILYLSNILWKINVDGVSKEVEEKISSQLMDYGVRPGKLLINIDQPGIIQQKLLHDIPELLWIGVHKKGTTYQLEGVEKTIVKKKEKVGPRHLVAEKKGIIKSMYVKKGMAMVDVHDVVNKGDILVSGTMPTSSTDNEEKDKDEEERTGTHIAADGEVTAYTWYEVNVNVPLDMNHEQLTGNQISKYFLQFNKINLPVWGFNKVQYDHTYTETNEQPIYLFSWKTPVSWTKVNIFEKDIYNQNRTKDEAIEVGKKQAIEELKLQLGPKAKIISEKILHERVENGKVYLNLYITVEEDIAIAEPITQGD